MFYGKTWKQLPSDYYTQQEIESMSHYEHIVINPTHLQLLLMGIEE